jgi:GNAT superfamily N-acetyltransferase
MPDTSAEEAIREALPSEISLLLEIEQEADDQFFELGIGPFAEDDSESHLVNAAIVLVAGDPPIGFASVEIVDGMAHLWQLSVRPAAGRRGIGRALVMAVCRWADRQGYTAVTLTTYRDVPWNKPFYEKLGFRLVSKLTPELAAIREHERTIGDDDFGPRLAMRRELTLPDAR